MVNGDRGDDRDRAVGDVGGVPGAARAHLDDRDVDRRVRERGERHRGEQLEEGQLHGLLPVDHCRVRREVLVGGDEVLLGQGIPVDADPFPHRGQVRAGVQAGAQATGPQQGVGHPRGGGLAVGAGHMDHRVRPLRIAEQRGQRGDPVQRRHDRVLRRRA